MTILHIEHFTGKKAWIGFRIAYASTVFSRPGPSDDYLLFPNLKRWLCGRPFESNEEVELETEGYFGGFDKSYYLEGIEKFKDCWTRCIELKECKNKTDFWQKI